MTGLIRIAALVLVTTTFAAQPASSQTTWGGSNAPTFGTSAAPSYDTSPRARPTARRRCNAGLWSRNKILRAHQDCRRRDPGAYFSTRTCRCEVRP